MPSEVSTDGGRTYPEADPVGLVLAIRIGDEIWLRTNRGWRIAYFPAPE